MSRRHDSTAPAPKVAQQRPERELRLVRVFPPVREPEAHWCLPLDGGRVVLGRDPGRGGFELDDDQASRRHCAISAKAELGTGLVEDLESRNGTFINSVAIEREYLTAGDVLRVGASLFVLCEHLPHPGVRLPEALPGVSRAWQQAEAVAERAAKSPLPALVSGPTGAGKERIARRLHEHSGRGGAFVALNCATLPQDLVPSELFGHVKGAFSGAGASRAGLFREADGGTLFLDEIAELPLAQQPSLLRVLQEGRVRPVGADREIAVDVRLVAATHKDLRGEEQAGRFRADLLGRLAGVEITLPALAERREEVLSLFARFLGREVPLTPAAAEALLLHDWPSNIRELEHAAQATQLFLDEVDAIDLPLLPTAVQRSAQAQTQSDESVPTRGELRELLSTHQGNVAEVARALGKHRQQVYRWLRSQKLDPKEFRGA